jgi:hypothetical protein
VSGKARSYDGFRPHRRYRGGVGPREDRKIGAGGIPTVHAAGQNDRLRIPDRGPYPPVGPRGVGEGIFSRQQAARRSVGGCCGLDLNQHTLSGTCPSDWPKPFCRFAGACSRTHLFVETIASTIAGAQRNRSSGCARTCRDCDRNIVTTVCGHTWRRMTPDLERRTNRRRCLS